MIEILFHILDLFPFEFSHMSPGCKGMRERLNWRWKNSPSFEGLPPESDLSVCIDICTYNIQILMYETNIFD